MAAEAVAAGGVVVPGCVPRPSPTYPPQSGMEFEGVGAFPSGIGSGDPIAEAMLLWTRVHPNLDTTGAEVIVSVEILDSARTMLGTVQRDWLFDLRDTLATFRVERGSQRVGRLS